ncbi:MAG: Hpt domain-containing protein [Bacteroidales bacterium]|jgi:HPt (histidine-containing phosphotransfer) domain-containing protein|nr:Hpt domain-containing protein [Bacteroidales bacterium]
MTDKLYDLKKIIEISSGDDNFVREMVVTFVENVTDEIENIEQLKKNENWTTIAEISHKLVSNYAYLGADDLRTTAADIEKSVVVDHRFDEIAEKATYLCNHSKTLINKLKVDFNI